MAFKGKGKPRRANQQNSLFKRKKFCRFTAEGVKRSTTRTSTRSRTSSRKTARSCRLV